MEHLASRVPGGSPAQDEVKRFHALWEAAASDIHSTTPDGGGVDAGPVLAALGVKQFREALMQVRVNRGMTLRQLAEASDDGTGERLSASAISNGLHRDSLPSKSFVTKYLSACGLDAEAQREWLQVMAVLEGQALAQNSAQS
ncbi:helix-turn-helix domain-containing protein [Streptomyces chryseus]|uniref:helix-turn-helix domain-containing protein n=1 Tax=Streptomyces chryseus TaxID=68186 RepID=UPI00110FAC8E|nr:helix-turn-helix transcriptional regulator [Streptomyces chryseus]